MTARTTRQGLWFASALFVLSGATGLAYEVIWFKRFAHVWGSSSLAMASVVASFLAGLGLGATLAGRMADKSRRPLFAYALCEAGVAVCALLIPFVIPWLVSAAASLYPMLENRPLVHTLVRVLITFAVLGPPCVLMGATLPLLVRHFSISGLPLGRSVAWLYAFNALGAAAGGWIAGFHLLPSLGLEGANYVAAGLNLAIAAAALSYRIAPASEPGQTSSVSEPSYASEPSAASKPSPAPLGFIASPLDEPPPPAMALNAAALLAGFGSLLLQMIWGRELAVLLGPTTYAFTAMVFVFILGLGVGSLVFLGFARERSDLRRWIAVLVLLLIASTIAGRIARPQLAFFVGGFVAERGSPTFNAFLCAGISAALQFVPTLCMGILFPALVQLTRAGSAGAATSVGRIYAWNTVGSIAGALVALNWIVPTFGAAAATALALALYVAVFVLVLLPFSAERRRVELALGVLCGALLVVPWYRDADPRLTNLGLYVYGQDVRQRLTGPDSRVLYFKESSGANVMVMEQDQMIENGQPYGPPKIRNVRVNGKVDGSNFLDMGMQLGTAYVPLFLRPETKDVLVIGMGTGTTVGAALLFPETQVTVCEIEPAIIEGSRFFAEFNHDPHSSPRFRAVIDDGRNFMQASDRRFDLIISEPSNPWIAGVSNLFTHEFYVAAKAHLAPQGILTQWIQTYQLSAEQYALVVRTVSQVFPHCALIRIDHQDTLLMASQSPILPGRQALARAQEIVDETPAIRSDLKERFGTTDVRTLLLTLYVLDQEGVRRMLAADGRSEVNTDINLRLEFDAPRDLFVRAGVARKDPQDLILSSVQPAMYARTVSDWGYNKDQLAAFRALRGLFQQRRLLPQTVAIIELALAYEPDDPEFMADQMSYAPSPDPAEFEASVRRLMDLSIDETYRVGRHYAQSADPARGRIVLETLRERMPQSATLWTSLAAVYAALAREDDARAALAKARELDPLNSFARDMQRASQ